MTIGPTPLSTYEPTSPGRGGIILCQEAFGVTEHISTMARRLADLGWTVAVPHFFHREGDPVLGYDDVSVVFPFMQALTSAGVMDDVDVARTQLHERGFDDGRIGIVGFCMGGTIALAAATRRNFGAAVTFYGSGISKGMFGFDALAEEAPRLKAPWLGIYGDKDHAIPVDEIVALEQAARTSGQVTEVLRYPEAGHAFMREGWSSHHTASAASAWPIATKWLDDHLVG